ncbi:ABC transporter substrate-binding protein [Enterococcus durans]|uniref:ABC transporter substrate-binding protein n=1 Tax=Enterococcus durans TaxID=53345 RepID=UPI0020735076|nr:ABC transporter substrate-binding protein [Enterococcus durans]MCM6856443.1 ABC transporter substrate-binding protein [Enterococcus durans]
MKKRMIFLVAAAALALAGCGSGTSVKKEGNSADAKTFKLGVNLELSGAVAAYGDVESDGIKLAVDEINKDGGIDGKKIEIVDKDNKSDNDEAASVSANLATNEKVVAQIGPATSGASKSSLANLTKAGVPMITPSGTDDSITVDGDKVQKYAFRSCFQDSFQGTILAQYADNKLNSKKAVILSDSSSDYAKGLSKAFKDEYKGQIVDEENFVAGDKDFQAILTNIKDKDFDVLYIPAYYTEAGLIVKQAREMGIKQAIVGADGFGDEKFVETAGAANASNIYYTAHFSTSAPASDKVPAFVDAFQKKYNTASSQFAALAYDAVYMVKQAAEKEGTDSASIQKGLANLKDFKGVTGSISIDKNHNPEKSAVVLGLTNGKESSADAVNPE